MRTHDVFHLSLLRKDPDNPLPDQVQKPSGLVTVEDEFEWKINDILNSRHFGRNKRLQYRVKWKGYQERDLIWYNVDDDEFYNSADLLDDYH